MTVETFRRSIEARPEMYLIHQTDGEDGPQCRSWVKIRKDVLSFHGTREDMLEQITVQYYREDLAASRRNPWPSSDASAVVQSSTVTERQLAAPVVRSQSQRDNAHS